VLTLSSPVLPDKPGELEEKGRKRLNTTSLTSPIPRPQDRTTTSAVPDQTSKPSLVTIQSALRKAIPLTCLYYFPARSVTRWARRAYDDVRPCIQVGTIDTTSSFLIPHNYLILFYSLCEYPYTTSLTSFWGSISLYTPNLELSSLHLHLLLSFSPSIFVTSIRQNKQTGRDEEMKYEVSTL